MPEEKGLVAGLFDFAFEASVTRKIVRLLYVILLLGGGVSVVALVVMAMQQSPAQGLLVLVSGVVAFFVWILLVRVGLEVVLTVLRIADSIERATRTGA